MKKEDSIISNIPQLEALSNVTLEISGNFITTDLDVRVVEMDETVKMIIEYSGAVFTVKGAICQTKKQTKN